jgi:hypothetical protein
MAGALSVKIQGLEEFKAAVKKAPALGLKHLGIAIKSSIFEIQREAVPLTPTSEGRLRGSFRASFSALKGELSVDASYALFVHEGTRPHWPPFQEGTPLARWAHLHGIEPFLVARSISIHGTKAHPFLREGTVAAFPAVRKHFVDSFRDFLREVAQAQGPLPPI